MFYLIHLSILILFINLSIQIFINLSIQISIYQSNVVCVALAGRRVRSTGCYPYLGSNHSPGQCSVER